MTSDYKRTLSGLCKLGIGPWRIYESNPDNTPDQTYRGRSIPFSMLLCFADLSPSNIVYEVIQPLSGPTIFQEFLDKQGEGIHHIAYDCNNIPWEDRLAEFEKRGFVLAQGGDFRGENKFAFFESEETGTCFETIAFREGYVYPEPDEWFPARQGDNSTSS